MARFERIRERLPSLYRPEDADPSGDPIPLLPEQLAAINGDPVSPGRVAATRGGLLVDLGEPVRIENVRLAPGTVIGSLATLQLYRIAGGTPLAMPGAVARLTQGEASIATLFRESSFVVRLSRPGLLSQLIWAAGRVLDDVDLEASQVMQAHWIGYADHARFSSFVHRRRALRGEPAPVAEDPVVSSHPYIHDLGRIGAMLGMLPWRDPLSQREVVESYRRRILRTVELYRNGLGTVAAIRRMVEIQLPVEEGAPPGLRDLPFTVEEYAPLTHVTRPALVRGPPDGIVGPLMRWELTNEGLAPARPTLYIEGVPPEPDRVDAAERPLIELFSAGGERVRLGIAYDGTVAPGETLRIRPAHSCWIAAGDEVLRADTVPSGELPADPIAAGPWSAEEGFPAAAVTALVQAADLSLWAAAGGALYRFDGAVWSEALSGLSEVRCLAVAGDDLLIGTAQGLLRLPLHPPEGESLAPTPEPGSLAGPPVNALLRSSEGSWWVGSDEGLARLAPGDVLEPLAFGGSSATTAVLALHEDDSGNIHIGTALGAFQFQPGLGHWYWYAGADFSDQVPDWVPLEAGAGGADEDFPEPDRVFLPAVHAIHRGADGSIWFGTERGIACYRARSVGGPAYTVHLEAFPDLATGRVHQIAEDERGTLWFATDEGLFRFDGRDWWQLQSGSLVRLPLGSSGAANERVPRHWRFVRDQDRWEFFDPAAGAHTWTAFVGEPRGVDAPPARAIIWTDAAYADLGSWSGDDFVPSGSAAPGALRTRYKPDDTRCFEGGIAAIPRLPVGTSVWRYLALESGDVEPPAVTPAWTREGRLIPPPEDREAVEEGRYSGPPELPELSHFDQAAFAYNPAARVRARWEGTRTLTVLVRLGTTAAMPQIEPAVLDRAWKGIDRVRPAGVTAMLAVGEQIVRGRG